MSINSFFPLLGTATRDRLNRAVLNEERDKMHVGLYVTENPRSQCREEAVYLTVIDPLMVGGGER